MQSRNVVVFSTGVLRCLMGRAVTLFYNCLKLTNPGFTIAANIGVFNIQLNENKRLTTSAETWLTTVKKGAFLRLQIRFAQSNFALPYHREPTLLFPRYIPWGDRRLYDTGK